MTHSRIIALTTGVAVLGALASIRPVAAEPRAAHASASIVDASGNRVGSATFVEDATGTLHVNVHVRGLPSGAHGTHIHAVGACSPDFSAAAAHHDPLGAPHGTHAGDLPNLVVNPAGQGRLTGSTDRATLTAGPVSVFDADGAAIVIHALPDDFVTQPTGGSGARIACGIITSG